MNDDEAAAFYADPANRAITGPGRKRQGPTKSSMVPVRFDPAVIEAVKVLAGDSGQTVSAWIRRAVQAELDRAKRERPAGLIEGSGRGMPPRALRSPLTLVSTQSTNTTAGNGLVFRCAHMSVGNVVAAECAQCGPLHAVA
jgi:hypothetical protein